MSVLTLIDGIPLFTTVQQAVDWGAQYNIQGYHTHTYNGIVGYMSGDNHNQMVSVVSLAQVPEEVQESFNVVEETPAVEEYEDIEYLEEETAETDAPIIIQPTTTTTTTTTTTSTSSGGTSGGY